ncbi:amino acid ABC transporter ATP-binding protein [Leekyejoonella antrihumi]|uniref:ABC-type polar-amino-acid transporter n=1 Tax=Leekyejoonella antrihumi TaxID=1660198 RepID=A0A563DXU2_9MICO|nr:amino acid ABC transporter ATP-binding protein [Leekyejoonella antrihumi]TWP34494.1 amino acid ABC transporter ATP-binding protein [Leekyejoonella antrihumi]
MVRIRGVHKRFDKVEVLRGVDLDVQPNTTTCLLGPSGSGKTTLLRCINHLERVDAGQIFVDGHQVGYTARGGKLHEQSDKEIAAARRRTGMVFQQFNLFPHRTALENVMEGPVRVLRQDKHEARTRATQLLEQVGLGERMHHYPTNLSGGQQQRVGIARALAMDPKVLLFDEPTSALDPELVGEVLDVIRCLDGRTMIIVTHEIGFARECADTIVFMDGGSVLEQGSPQDVLNNPKSPRTENFLRRVL